MYLPSILRSVALAAAAPVVNGFTMPHIPANGMLLVFGQPVSVLSPRQYVIAAHQIFNPNAFNFWREAGILGDKLVHYTDNELQKAAATYASVAERIDEFKETMEKVIAGTKQFAYEMHEGIDLELVSEKLAAELNTVLEELKVEFSQPLPGDEVPRQVHRDKMVSIAMGKVEDAVVRVNALWGVSEETSRAHFKEFEPHATSFLFICGQVIDEHPILIETILFTGAALMIPEAWFLRPILSLFGFGPYGPVKGSAAAWAQRRFWGAAVAEKSWFARLQAAGMKIQPPGLCKAAGGGLGVGVGVTAGLFSLCGLAC